MKEMINLLVMSLLIFSAQSCVGPEKLEEQPGEPDSSTAPQIGESRWEIRSLSGEEANLAREFCRVLDRKRNVFRRDYLGANLSFKVERKDCGLKLEKANVTVRLGENPISGDLEFITQSFDLPVMEDVQTVDRGIFSEFCPGLLGRSQSTNTMDFGEASIQQFRFVSVTSGTRAQIKTLQIVEGLEKVTALDEITLNNISRSGRPEGLVLERIRLEACNGRSSNKNSFFWRQRL